MSDLFKTLARTHHPFTPVENFTGYFGKWVILSSAVFSLSFFLLPVQEDLSMHLTETSFFIENILWLLLAGYSSFGFYRSSFPQKTDRRLWAPALLLLLGLFTLAIFRDHQDSLGLVGEASLMRGRCGFIIMISALLQSLFLFRWAKKTAPHSLTQAGLWSGLCSASLGCLLMQVVCAHDNPAHLLLWHFIPLTLVCSAGMTLSKKLLRW